MIILKKNPVSNIQHILFDFDGTLATTRAGWENVMGPYMIEVLMAAGWGDNVGIQVRKYIDESSGIQTIYQMEWLVNEVTKCGLEPLDVLDYKKEYVRRMVCLSESRIRKVERGEIDRSELMIAGAVDFIEASYNAGIILHIASGTDQEYVRRDAAALSVDQFFGGRIYGAGVSGYSKKAVIKELIKQYKLNGSRLAVFGDGHVEIEEAKAVGAIGIGVAVNEANRHGYDDVKIDKLTAAGADILIPDFIECDQLIKMLWE